MKISDIYSWQEYDKIIKGSQGSGNFGHAGRPGEVGGSGEGGGNKKFGKNTIKSAVNSIEILSMTSHGNVSISKEEQEFLKQTVSDKSYTVYRGMYLMKFRMSAEQYEKAKNLKEGEIAPDFLFKHSNNYASSSQLLSVAKEYAKDGNIEIVLEAKPNKEQIICDTANLEGLLSKHGFRSLLSKEIYSYYKKDKEVFLLEPVKYSILSIKVKKK